MLEVDRTHELHFPVSKILHDRRIITQDTKMPNSVSGLRFIVYGSRFCGLQFIAQKTEN